MYTSIVDIDNTMSIQFHLKGERIFMPYLVIECQGIGAELRPCRNRKDLRECIRGYSGSEQNSERMIDEILWDIAMNDSIVNHYFRQGQLPEWFMAFEPNFKSR